MSYGQQDSSHTEAIDQIPQRFRGRKGDSSGFVEQHFLRLSKLGLACGIAVLFQYFAGLLYLKSVTK
jgi:hypothetical protein